MKVEIKWLSDSHDCETCGSSYAEGATVDFDGERVLTLKPFAHCFGGTSWDREEVYRLILAKLGHEVEEDSV